MPNDNPGFVIDDARTTEENLAAFAQLLEGLDAELGPALAAHLSASAKGQSPDAPALWDELYAATAGVEGDAADNGEDGERPA